MLNIEVIRFEAQDVITASVPAMPMFPAMPNKPAQPSKPVEPTVPATPVEPLCACGRTGVHGYNSKSGEHKVYTSDDGDYFLCTASSHTCGY